MGGQVDTIGNLPTGNIQIDSGGLWIGREQDCVGGCWDPAQDFDGIIDDISIYNRTLDSTEVQQPYTLGQYDISWSTGDTTSTITVGPTTNTTYTVTVDDGISSCSDSVTVSVSDP